MKSNRQSDHTAQGDAEQTPCPGSTQQKRDKRFLQLLAEAEQGKEEAVADLFREFNFRFGQEEA